MNCAERPGYETDRPTGGRAGDAVIARAEGALMAAHGCSERVAAGILSGVARGSGTELRAVAETVAAIAETNAQCPPEAIRAAITCALRDVLP